MVNNVAFGIITGVIFISLIALFCVLLVKLYIHKVKTYTEVIYQKDIAFQVALNTTVIETQEQVLNNISQDLHDDAGQQLTYINFQLENLKLDSPEWHETLSPISKSVNSLSESIRSISHSLNNHLLTQQDIVKAIRTEVERLSKNGRIVLQFMCKETLSKDISANDKIIIYRIFQEIINNIFKHSSATFVDIKLTTRPHFELIVSDDGRGFNHGENKSPTLGLQGMKERAAIINYKLDIQSIPGTGTTIKLSETNTN